MISNDRDSQSLEMARQNASRTVEDWQEPNRKGTIAYVDDDGRPRGFLLWNVWSKVDAARDAIKAGVVQL